MTMNEIGHNNPPTQIALCDQVAEDISGWLAEHPDFTTEEDARQAKLHLDRGKLGLKDLEDERDKAVRPLNEEVKAINESYRPTKTIIGALLDEIGKRIKAYLLAEEQKRIKAAQEAARIAAEAEAKAREAERLERDALAQSETGELGVDLKARTMVADATFSEYQKAERQAQIAEKETHVKLGGGFSRAASLRSVEVLIVSNAVEAIQSLGLTDDIRDGILKSARAYRKLFGDLPDGVEAEMERKI